MRMFLYYAFHSVVNQIRKLLKTWVAILIAMCFVIGFAASAILFFVNDGEETENTAETEEISETAETEEVTDTSETEFSTEDLPDITFYDDDGNVIATGELSDILDAGATCLIIIIFIFLISSADKANIFLPADVSCLFASPLTPQSVAVFRTGCNMGVLIVGVFYALIYAPSLVTNFELGWIDAMLGVASMMAGVLVAVMIRILAYIYSFSKKNGVKTVRIILYGSISLFALGLVIYATSSGTDFGYAALKYLSADFTRYIPVVGWIKAAAAYSFEGNILAALAFLALVLLSIVGIAYVTSKIKADYYEDAMCKAEETADLTRAMSEGKSLMPVIRKSKKEDNNKKEKERKENSYILKHGSGANVYFFKTLYSKWKFGKLYFITGGTWTHFTVAVIATAIIKFGFKTDAFAVVAIAVGVIAFYKSLGNPLCQDTGLHYFSLIPDGTIKKIFWSILGGCVCCLIDILPGFIVAAVVFGADILTVLGWILFTVSLDFFSTAVGTFIGVSLPENAGNTVKIVVQNLFIYFGAAPDIVVLALMRDNIFAGGIISAAINIGVAFVFALLSVPCIEKIGGKTVGKRIISKT